MDFDVIVIGGSAVGGAAAASCARNGLSTAILEEDKHVGKYKRCTAICSEAGLKSTKIPYQNSILNRVRGAVIHSPNKSAEISMNKDRGIVFDRQQFDENSIDRAIYYGAELYKEHRAISFRHFSYDNYSVFAGKTFNSSAIIGADGVASHTAYSFGFPTLKSVAYCYEREVTNIEVPYSDLVDVFIDNENLPGFFGWSVPVDERTVRVGFGTTALPQLMKAKKFFYSQKSLLFIKSKKARILRKFNAAIPLGPRKRTQQGNVLLAGDAAGQTKATTGGGLIFGSLCADIAGQSLHDHLNMGKKLDYERRWRRECGMTLESHRKVRKTFDRLPNRILDISVSALSLPIVNSAISKFGDMDYILKF